VNHKSWIADFTIGGRTQESDPDNVLHFQLPQPRQEEIFKPFKFFNSYPPFIFIKNQEFRLNSVENSNPQSSESHQTSSEFSTKQSSPFLLLQQKLYKSWLTQLLVDVVDSVEIAVEEVVVDLVVVPVVTKRRNGVSSK